MRIRRLNENVENLESHIVFSDNDDKEIPKLILSRNIIEDYFSLIESYGEVSIRLCALIPRGVDNFDEEEVDEEDTVLYQYDIEGVGFSKLIYHVAINIDIDTLGTNFLLNNGNDYDAYFSDINRYYDTIKQLFSIKNKIESHNHSIEFSVRGNGIECIIKNKE